MLLRVFLHMIKLLTACAAMTTSKSHWYLQFLQNIFWWLLPLLCMVEYFCTEAFDCIFSNDYDCFMHNIHCCTGVPQKHPFFKDRFLVHRKDEYFAFEQWTDWHSCDQPVYFATHTQLVKSVSHHVTQSCINKLHDDEAWPMAMYIFNKLHDHETWPVPKS